MTFRNEIRERLGRLEGEVRGLTEILRDFHKDFMSLNEKREEIERQVREAQTSERSKLYERRIEEDEEESLAGEIVEMEDSK